MLTRVRSLCLGGLVVLLAVWLSLFRPPPSAQAWAGEMQVVRSFPEIGDYLSDAIWADWDNDGDLDLALVQHWSQGRGMVFENEGGALSLAWDRPLPFSSGRSLDWGDYDNDGWLDLAIGGCYPELYRNTGSDLALSWTAGGVCLDHAQVAWGDLNGDGYDDLAVGAQNNPLQIYASDGISLTLAWTAPVTVTINALGWADVDGDLDLDLAVGSVEGLRIYYNNGGVLDSSRDAPDLSDISALAWADWDNDGDSDLAVGLWRDYGYGGLLLLTNEAGSLTQAWAARELNRPTSLDWGDWDGDGDPDLAVGNNSGSSGYTMMRLRIYEAHATGLALGWSSSESDGYDQAVLAWGDFDGDGDADLFSGGQGVGRLLGNQSGRLDTGWTALTNYDAYAVAWGDLDGDADLDLALGSADAGLQVWRNHDGVLSLNWTAPLRDSVRALAWGDVDGDGDLDLAAGTEGGPIRLYTNTDGTLGLLWSSPISETTRALAWADFDHDGDLDLAAGGPGHPLRLYTNTADGLALHWSAAVSEMTTSLAWADYDGDSDLDLAVGSDGSPVRLYANIAGGLSLAWSAALSETTTSLAWGDWDGDGSPDLAVGNYGQPLRLYENSAGTLALAWSSTAGDHVTALQWADWDADGDLDLAVGSFGEANKVYANLGGDLIPLWAAEAGAGTRAIAWGDWDNDGDLDLAAANHAFQPLTVYANQSDFTLAWSALEQMDVSGLAWGDMDNDGDLDMAISVGVHKLYAEVYSGYNRVYRRTPQGFELAWTAPVRDHSTGVAWADYDGDGDLDLSFSAGRYSDENDVLQGGFSRLYRNDSGAFTLVWTSPAAEEHWALAWADVDLDGDLDLGVGRYDKPLRIYYNENGVLGDFEDVPGIEDVTTMAWGDYDHNGYPDLVTSSGLLTNQNGKLGAPVSVASKGGIWGDWDGDGDLDLGFGEAGAIYRNDSGEFQLGWSFPADGGYYGHFYDRGLAFVDWNLDFNLDGGAIHYNSYSDIRDLRLYTAYGHTPQLRWESPDYELENTQAWGDYDGDGDTDLVTGVGMVDPGGNIGPIVASYGQLRIYENHANDAQALTDTAPRVSVRTPGGGSVSGLTGNFAMAVILQGPEIEIEYTLRDLESDPVRFIRAWFSLDGGSTWRPAVSASGTITQNLAASPAGMTHAFTWDLFGSGVTGSSDTTLFRIDAVQGFDGPGPYQYAYRWAASNPFRVRGAQVRVMRDGQPASGAWVLRQPAGLTSGYQLYRDLTGEPLVTGAGGYLLGSNQMAIGDTLVALAPVTGTDTYMLYHSSAAPTLIGVEPYTITQAGVQILEVYEHNSLVLFNLDVSLEWDARYDAQFLSRLQYDFRRTSELLFDWSNGQMALGTVTVYHARQNWTDAHIQIYVSNRLRPNAAQGGITDVEIDDPLAADVVYQPGQVRMGAVWNRFGDAGGNLGEDWARALAHELGHYAAYLDDNYMGFNALGQLVPVTTCPGAMSDPYRDDYSEFRPLSGWLTYCANTLSHQTTGRADWQTITTFYPALDGVGTNSGPSGLPLAITQVSFVSPPAPDASLPIPIFYLSQDGHSVQPGGSARAFLFLADGETVIDLGRPNLDQVLARGAAPGDRLCVFEPGQNRLGCETISAGDEQLALTSLNSDLPLVDLEALDEQQIGVSVGGLEGGLDVRARLYPADGGAPVSAQLDRVGDAYTGVLKPAEPAPKAMVHVWVDEDAPAREMVTDYILGGNPAYVRGRMAHVRGRMAPAVSADGQVILFGSEMDFAEGEFYSLQALSAMRDAPPWTTPVGQVYRLLASANAPSLTGASISFSYLGSEVPPGEESWLKIGYSDESVPGHWETLPTTLDTDNNHAVADAQGPGLYVLMSSLEIPLYREGWNLFSYPIQATRPISDALISISSYYTTVYGFEGADLVDPWKLYDITVPGWVNDLHTLEFAHAYWIQTTQAITLSLRGAVEALSLPLSIFEPPATFFGAVLAEESFMPAAGQEVQTWIDGELCGLGQTLLVEGQVVYSVNVMADGAGDEGCGAPGRSVNFLVDGQAMEPDGSWTNLQVQALDLSPAGVEEAYTLTVDVIGEGSVSREPNQSLYLYGSVVTLTATPDPGWSFAGWSGDLTSHQNVLILQVQSNTQLTATFVSYKVYMPLVSRSNASLTMAERAAPVADRRRLWGDGLHGLWR